MLLQAPVLETVLQPQALVGFRYMGELGANATRIDLAQLHENLAQLHLLLDASRAAAGVELGLHVGIRQTHIGWLEHARHRPLHQAERVDVGDQVAAIRVELDQPRNGRLLFGISGRRHRRNGCGLSRRLPAFHRRGWPRSYESDSVRRAGTKAFEECAPFGRDGRWIVNETLEERLKIGRLGARERARFV